MEENKIISIKRRSGNLYIACLDIVYCVADGAYTTIYVKGGKGIVVSKNLGKVMEIINVPYIVRVGQSAAVNVLYISRVYGRGGIEEKRCVIELSTGDKVRYTLSSNALNNAIEQALLLTKVRPERNRSRSS